MKALMEEANALWRRKLAEVKQLGASLARMQQRSPDIDPEVWTVLLCRLADDAATAASEPTKICSAGCGLAENSRMFSKKQWSARAVRRCLACMKADVEPKLCAHGKGAFDCAACIAIVKREAEAEAAAEAADEEQYNANTKYTEAVVVATKTCAEDAKGQTCYICTQALHWETKEGLVRGCSCPGTAGFAHLSCLAEQAKILMDEAEENNLGAEVLNARLERWYRCSLCEQTYHGAVACALAWACWKTYLGRPETDLVRGWAMNILGNGLHDAGQFEDSLSVKEAELSMAQRFGDSESNMLITQGNLANAYAILGRQEEALRMRRKVYSGFLKLYGEEHEDTLREGDNYTLSLLGLKRFDQAKTMLCRMMPVARRALGPSHRTTLRMSWHFAMVIYENDRATLDDLREAVTTLADAGRIARRVLGGAHPLTVGIEGTLRKARAALRARETPSGSA